MLPSNTPGKIFATLILSFLLHLLPHSLFAQTANYEAATWKTKMLDNPNAIYISNAASATSYKTELPAIKQKLKSVDDKKLQNIKYWNAGAPSYRWNQIVLALTADKQEVLLRIPAAWMNLAIYDATILCWKEKVKYKRPRPSTVDPSIKPLVNINTWSFPCEHTVTAAAAANILAYFFPEKKDSIMLLAHQASQSRIDAGVQYASDADAGWILGEAVAKEIIAKAENDGSKLKWDGNMNQDPKKWTGKFPMGITIPLFTPIAMNTADQFRLPPPPDFEKDMNELKNFKQNFNSRATAYFWAGHGPELWNDLVSQKMFENHIDQDAPAAARIYCTLNVAFHDAVIAIFDTKYKYWGIRPNQYDTTYKSLITTPPFPGYPSGHAGGAGTCAAVLEYFFPTDSKLFHSMAQECADSRFYAGIHFKTDNEAALAMGYEIGKYVVQSFMKK
jgi:membrane-associated phospholipid phosphatase